MTAEQNVENMSEGSWQKINLEQVTEPGAENLEQGHVTTDSSDSSESDGPNMFTSCWALSDRGARG